MSKCSCSLNSKTISITWCKSEPAVTVTVTAKPASILPADQEGEAKKTDDDLESQKSLQTPEVSVADILPSSSAVHSHDENTTNSESNDSIANLVRTATDNLKAEAAENLHPNADAKDEEEENEKRDTALQADTDNDNANANCDIFDMLFESKEDGDDGQ